MKYYNSKLLTILVILGFCVKLEAAYVLPSINKESEIILKLGKNEVAIFGYGSLMLEEELHDQPYTEPLIMGRLKGFKRSWSAHYPNKKARVFLNKEGLYFRPETITYLNIEPCSGSVINGIIFVTSKSNLKSYDDREAIYDRIKINEYLEGVRVIGGDIYTYMDNEGVPTSKLSAFETVILKGYILKIKKALDRLGEGFKAEFYESTQPTPWHLVY